MKLSGTCRNVSFSDVTNGYIYVLFGFFAHLYIIFAGSLYFALEEQLTTSLNVRKETIINYFSFFSIILLIISLSLKWTWARVIRIEELLLIFFMWVLLRNLIPKECLCCGSVSNQQIIDSLAKAAAAAAVPPTLNPSPSPSEDVGTATPTNELNIERKKDKPPSIDDNCPWEDFNTIYSALCVVVMISSFLMNARNRVFSLFFTVLAIILMIFTTLLPVSCNQLNVVNANLNLLKFTFFSIVWFLKKRMHMTEHFLFGNYLKSIRIMYSYQDARQNHLLCGVRHHNNTKNKKRKRPINTNATATRHCDDTCDDIAQFINGDEDCLIPRALFNNLDELSSVVLKQKAHCNSSSTTQISQLAWQSHQLLKIHQIHCSFSAKRWFGNFFSWKHRFYDTDILNLFDLTKTLWILNICPIFLFFVFIEYFLLLYHIWWNIKELECLIERVKVMTHIRCTLNEVC